MASFGFSIGDIVLATEYAHSVYKSCKYAGNDFRSIAADGACKKDLEDLKTTLARYKSLGKSNPRTRDRLGFTKNKQSDIRETIKSHCSRLQRFVNAVTVVTISRIEGHAETQVLSLADIKAKLDEISEDLRSGRRAPTSVRGFNGMLQVEAEVLQEGDIEEDIDLRSEISDWVTKIRGFGDVDTIVQTSDDEPDANTEPLVTQIDASVQTEDEDRHIHGVGETGHETSTGLSASLRDTVDTTPGNYSAKIDSKSLGYGLGDGSTVHFVVLNMNTSRYEKTDMWNELRDNESRVRFETSGPHPDNCFARVVEVNFRSEELSIGMIKRYLLCRSHNTEQGLIPLVVPFQLRIAPGTPNGYRIRQLGLSDQLNLLGETEIIFEIKVSTLDDTCIAINLGSSM